MTEKIAFTIAFIPLFLGILIMKISRNPRYLILYAFLTGLSGVLLLILSPDHKYFGLIFFGLALFILFVKWYRDKWYHDKQYRKKRR